MLQSNWGNPCKSNQKSWISQRLIDLAAGTASERFFISPSGSFMQTVKIIGIISKIGKVGSRRINMQRPSPLRLCTEDAGKHESKETERERETGEVSDHQVWNRWAGGEQEQTGCGLLTGKVRDLENNKQIQHHSDTTQKDQSSGTASGWSRQERTYWSGWAFPGGSSSDPRRCGSTFPFLPWEPFALVSADRRRVSEKVMIPSELNGF